MQTQQGRQGRNGSSSPAFAQPQNGPTVFGLENQRNLSVGIHGAQHACTWEPEQWAHFFFNGTVRLPMDTLKAIAADYQKDDSLLIQFYESLAIARAGNAADRGEPFGVNDDYLAGWGVIPYIGGFIECALAFWANADVLIKHVYKKTRSLDDDVTLTQLLVVAERVAAYEGVNTEASRCRFEKLAEEARAAQIRYAWQSRKPRSVQSSIPIRFSAE